MFIIRARLFFFVFLKYPAGATLVLSSGCKELGGQLSIVFKILYTIPFLKFAVSEVFYFNFCRTCARERGHLVLQIGTSNGDRAAQVAKKLEQGEQQSHKLIFKSNDKTIARFA